MLSTAAGQGGRAELAIAVSAPKMRLDRHSRQAHIEVAGPIICSGPRSSKREEPTIRRKFIEPVHQS